MTACDDSDGVMGGCRFSFSYLVVSAFAFDREILEVLGVSLIETPDIVSIAGVLFSLSLICYYSKNSSTALLSYSFDTLVVFVA